MQPNGFQSKVNVTFESCMLQTSFQDSQYILFHFELVFHGTCWSSCNSLKSTSLQCLTWPQWALHFSRMSWEMAGKGKAEPELEVLVLGCQRRKPPETLSNIPIKVCILHRCRLALNCVIHYFVCSANIAACLSQNHASHLCGTV